MLAGWWPRKTVLDILCFLSWRFHSVLAQRHNISSGIWGLLFLQSLFSPYSIWLPQWLPFAGEKDWNKKTLAETPWINREAWAHGATCCTPPLGHRAGVSFVQLQILWANHFKTGSPPTGLFTAQWPVQAVGLFSPSPPVFRNRSALGRVIPPPCRYRSCLLWLPACSLQSHFSEVLSFCSVFAEAAAQGNPEFT